jgi:predicted TIM-barrel fold metal-dependent hydrolase
VHPAAGAAALEEIRRAAGDGLIGLGELSPHSQHFPITDAVWRQILALAGELKMPVNLHVTDPASRKFPGRVETPIEDFAQLSRDFSETIFVLAHWGGGLASAQTLGARPNVFFDTAASPLLYDAVLQRKLFAELPAAKVLYGSDYPLVLYPRTAHATGLAEFIAGIRSVDLPADQLAAVLGGNAAGLFGL